MAGIVYLRTNMFEVKLEGITFKPKDFEAVCSNSFLFPDGKIWARPPVVGIDVLRHPRDPSVVLLLLCVGVGCLVIRFNSGDILPESMYKFLTDDRIQFVGFGIPEKKDIFPFQELGLTKSKTDIGYMAAKYLKNPKYKSYELAQLARKILKIRRMIGLTQASSFERQEQIKCSICQLFITCTIATTLLAKSDKKAGDAQKKSSFLKNLNSLPLFTEGWLKFPKMKKESEEKMNHVRKGHELPGLTRQDSDESDENYFETAIHQERPLRSSCIQAKVTAVDLVHDPNVYGDDLADSKSICATLGDNESEIKCTEGIANEDHPEETICSCKKPLKGILKSSTPRECLSRSNSNNNPPSGPLEQKSGKSSLKRANSKGYNVTFK